MPECREPKLLQDQNSQTPVTKIKYVYLLKL